ncbi:MAG: PilZ domain-containing protein [Sedimentisphaerales bacterium]|nr:PilZ domain-containing protein [Sedimentisphaerales bacterium]
MDIEKIEKIIQRLDMGELHHVQKYIAEQIKKLELTQKHLDDDKGRELRREERFETNLLGTLTRITDVKPGERKEYSVTVHDISKSGMRLKVDTNFIPSRVVEITFAGPGGKIKRCFLEIVRMRKMSNQDGNWLEVGCRSINNEEVRRMRLKEEKVIKTRSKLHSRRGILVLIVGTETEVNEKKLLARMKAQQYNVHRVDSLNVAMKSAEKTKAQLCIFCSASKLLTQADMLTAIGNRPPTLATLAIIEKEEDRLELLKAGVDECISEANYENFFFKAIERAMLGHAGRQGKSSHEISGRALIVSIDTTRINLISYQLEENGYSFRIASDIHEARNSAKDPFDLIFADFDINCPEEFTELHDLFSNLSVIALCDDFSHGQQAIVNGASNYLCMPPSKEDVQMILELAKAKLETSAKH